MMRRNRFLLVLFCAAVCCPILGAASEARAARRPNIVLIFADDLGWADVGYQGATYYETPNIDRLARQGMVFTDAYANAANCAPSRACLLSGQYSPRHGVYTVGSAVRGSAGLRKIVPVPSNPNLSAEVVTVAESLKTAGYATACFGKWHLGKLKPTQQGFDVALDHRSGRVLTDKSLQFIQDQRDRPFFLYLAHHLVHSPWKSEEGLIAKYAAKSPAPGHDHPVYAAMIEELDRSVGRVTAKLDELGLSEETVLWFFSDNGGVGMITSMAPLRGAKGMFYEGGIREPMIVRWPGKVAPGARCSTPVIAVDFYPTFLEIAGAAPPKGQPLDGESLVPLLTGAGSLDPRAIYWHFPCYLQSWACVQVPWRTTPVGVVRKGDWKLMEFFEDGRLELYNLKDDVGETVNLARKMPDKTAELHAKMRAWRKQVDAPIPAEPNPEYDPSERWVADPDYRGRPPHILSPGLGDHFAKALRLGYDGRP